MIYEGSCETKDWSKGCPPVTIILIIKCYISQNYCFTVIIIKSYWFGVTWVFVHVCLFSSLYGLSSDESMVNVTIPPQIQFHCNILTTETFYINKVIHKQLKYHEKCIITHNTVKRRNKYISVRIIIIWNKTYTHKLTVDFHTYPMIDKYVAFYRSNLHCNADLIWHWIFSQNLEPSQNYLNMAV